MHLKNLALLKIAEPGSRQFASVRFAPLYDAVTTRVFPGLAGDRMALKLNGKDDRMTPQDFLTSAKTIDLPTTQAEMVISDLSTKLNDAVQTVTLPKAAAEERGNAAEDAIGKIIADRVEAFL